MSEGKIIRGFGERLALDQEMQALGEAPNAFELERRARELAAKGEAILPALLRHLDTSNPTLRGGLGLLVQHLDRGLITPALYNAAADGRRPPEARLTAVMLLERYLNESIDPALAGRLPQASDVARQSAVQALDVARSQPLVLVEYAEQLLGEPADVIQAVIDVIAGLDDPACAHLLLAIAAYADVERVASIIQRLGGMRHTPALSALHTLAHLADPRTGPAIERQARKLRMAGVDTPAKTSLRALWSPLSAQGQSLLWFIRRGPGEESADLLILVLHDRLGILQAEAEAGLDLSGLPMPAPAGHLHRLRLPGSHHIARLAELEPSLALERLAGSMEQLRALELPWPGELVVYGAWLWAGPEPAPAAWPDLPAPAGDAPAGAFEKLLQHVAFAAWAWELPDIEALLAGEEGAALKRGSAGHLQVAARLVSDETAPILARRLREQARWLSVVGEERSAALALAAAAAVEAGEASHPFVQALAWRSLLTAAADRAARRTLRLRPDDE